MMLFIPYESEGFPPSIIRDGPAELPITWDDVLWAAVTVGRPNRYQVFRDRNVFLLEIDDARDGLYLMEGDYESVFRWSLIRMALEQRSRRARRLTRTDAAKALDPTEKGMVSYFLGMTFCKLFSAKLLDTPGLLHLDVFRPELDPVLSGRSRPDLVGQENGVNRWHGFECKGRVSPPDSTAKNKAKNQAQRLISVKGVRCSLHIGALTFFRNDVLHFYWCDPAPQDHEEIVLNLPDDAWRHYYSPVVEIITASDSGILRDSRSEVVAARIPHERDRAGNLQVPVEKCDLEIGVHRAIEIHIFNQEWDRVRHAASEAADVIREDGFQADGLRVCAGNSWGEEYQESIQFGYGHGES